MPLSMPPFPMGKLAFLWWALSRIFWLATVVVLSLTVPLISLYFFLGRLQKHWHKSAGQLWRDSWSWLRSWFERSSG